MKNASTLRKIATKPKRAAAIVFLFVAAVAATSASGANTRVVMKDGRIFEGAIFPTKSVVISTETKKESDLAPTRSDKILVIDDQLRRIFVPKYNAQDVEPNEAGASLEVFKIRQHVNENPAQAIAMLGNYRATSDFDEFGRRSIVASGTTIVQGITEIAPTYVRVRGLTHNLDMRLSPRAIPRKTITALIKKQIDPKSLEDRLRIYQFYVQASLYEQGVEELSEIIKDFQDDEENAERLEVALRMIRQLSAQRLVDELELRRAAGQHKKVKELLASFDSNNVSPEKIQAIRRMRRQYDEEDAKIAAIKARVRELAAGVANVELKVEINSLVSEIEKELNSNTLTRFVAFEQGERDGSLQNDNRLALGLSGWLVGNVGADTRLEIAVSLYRVRKLIRKYLLEQNPGTREEYWSEIRSEEASTPKQIAMLLSTMKPPTPPARSKKETPYMYELSVPSFQTNKTFEYVVQLPPEYDPNRKYPTVVTLHGERSSPLQQLNWWCGPWTQKTDEKGKEVYERYGQATRFGYIVVAPKWNEPGADYDFSAPARAAVLFSLRDAMRRFSIDSDRVYISGLGAGGSAAWDISLAHPDLWAGCIPICGAATFLTPILKENAAYMPLYAVGGELDGGKLVASRETLDWGMDLSVPFDMTYVQFRGRGVEPFSEETTRIFEWMGTRTRKFYFQDAREVYSARPWDNFFWNVELFGFPEDSVVDPVFAYNFDRKYKPAKTEFLKNANNNTIRILSKANRAVVFLSPEQVNFDAKIEVYFNTRKISPASGRIPASGRVILEDARTRADRKRPFWASLNSAFPGQYNEWDRDAAPKK